MAQLVTSEGYKGNGYSPTISMIAARREHREGCKTPLIRIIAVKRYQ